MTPDLYRQPFRMQSLRHAAVSFAVLLLLCGCSRSVPPGNNTEPMLGIELTERQFIDQLQSLMESRDYDVLFAHRDRIKQLTAADNSLLAGTAYAALMTVDGHIDSAWELAWDSPYGFTNLLTAISLLTDSQLRIALADRSIPLLDDDSLSLLSGWPESERLLARNAVIAALVYIPGREAAILAALESARQDPALEASATAALQKIATHSLDGELAPSRQVQKQYAMSHLKPALDWPAGTRSFARGRRLYHELGCHRCHVLSEHDTLVGPNLTGADYKATRRELAEAIIAPDKQIAENYRQYLLVVNGKPITGLVTEQTDDYLIVIADPMHDCTPQRIERNELDDDLKPLTTSAMPSGMVDVLTLEELLDLLAYVDAKANPENESFRQPESP